MTTTTYKLSRTFDQSAGAYSDADGIKESVATSDEAASYTGVALDGTNTAGTLVSAAVATGLASYPTFSSTSAASSYVNASTVTFTGTYQGQAVQRVAVLTGTDGNETEVLADGPMDIDSISQIDVEAQADANGAFTFGWKHLLPATGLWFMVARAAGNVHLTFQDGTIDTLPMAQYEQHLALVSMLHSDTAIDVTVYEQPNPPSY